MREIYDSSQQNKVTKEGNAGLVVADWSLFQFAFDSGRVFRVIPVPREASGCIGGNNPGENCHSASILLPPNSSPSIGSERPCRLTIQRSPRRRGARTVWRRWDDPQANKPGMPTNEMGRTSGRERLCAVIVVCEFLYACPSE